MIFWYASRCLKALPTAAPDAVVKERFDECLLISCRLAGDDEVHTYHDGSDETATTKDGHIGPTIFP